MPNGEVDALVVGVLAGDKLAWSQLWQMVESKLYNTLRRPYFLGRLSKSEDDCRTITVKVMARLEADDFARLRTWHDARRDANGPPFIAWLLVVAKRVAIDHMRAHDEYVDRRGEPGASSPGAWRLLDTLVANSREPGARPAFTDQAAAHEIMARADHLPLPQKDALAAWLAGYSYAEIARDRGFADEKQAERAVRAALAQLRRQFRED